MRTADNMQTRILEYIKEEIQTKGYPPSVREICTAVGLRSTSSVHAHLNNLEKKGLIRRDPTKPRALEVTDGIIAPRGKVVPLVGKVTAGLPITAIENIEEQLVMPPDYVGNRDEVFALRVSGESMINCGILDGDLVMVRKQQTAENGEIVVAMIDDEATVKRIYFEKDHVRLQPENDYMDPIYAEEVVVLGKVIALLRQY